MLLALATEGLDPHPLMVLPFVGMLLCIAVMPLLFSHIWERHYPKIALGLGSICVVYYLWMHGGTRIAGVLEEYVSFIVFIGSLFVVAGGIHIRIQGEARPLSNCLFLLIGAVLANLIGTTGASMLLIRPWVRSNKYRYTNFHTAFFIFTISNVGGCLTPIGDPPLFLGYLKGVPFWWVTQHCWKAWAFAVVSLVAIFYLFDRTNFVRAPRAIREMETAHETFKIEGRRSFLPLAAILVAVIFAPPILREIIMIASAVIAYRSTPRPIHDANHFTFGPIKEVAWLFAGIFMTMIPALDYLQLHAAALGLNTPEQFYWLSGALSGVLDNAPTYLAFLSAAFGLKHLDLNNTAHVAQFLKTDGLYVIAVSLGSVFFGAMTYIGNGPNLMVKSIADHAKVHTPHFFAYIFRFSLPVLLPVLAAVAFLLKTGRL
ncbi:MAG: sodium:proton antiporter [Chthoniobacterales bacterium]